MRAPDEIVHEIVAAAGYHVAHAESAAKGRAGVAVLSRAEPKDVRLGCGDAYFDDTGRWIEADVPLPDGSLLTIVSAYVHSGGVGTPQQDDKFRFLEQMVVRMADIRASGDHGIVTGDLNVGHTEHDIRNWKGNVGKAGFLPEERAYLDRVAGELGWVDVHRALSGDVRRAVHLVVDARPGVRQRHRLADRLPARHARARRHGHGGPRRPGAQLGRALVRPRAPGHRLRPLNSAVSLTDHGARHLRRLHPSQGAPSCPLS